MAQVLHQRAKTTHAIREDIQRSTASVATLSRRYNLNPKTVRKWRKRTHVSDRRMGPKQPRSTALSELEEAAAVTFRRTTWLPLDDCCFALQRFIPHLTRSSLHRLYQRHGISQLPRTSANKQQSQASFKPYPIGYLHMDICSIRTGEGKAHLFVAVDRTAKFVHARLYRKAQRKQAAEFLEDTLQQLPYRVHTVLTDSGPQFAKRQGTESYKPHLFDVVCYRHGIQHRLTRPFHPWTNGQVERMNRTLKDATVRSFHYATCHELSEHLQDYLWAYNSARPLRSLKGKTPVGFILQQWQDVPDRFYDDPVHYFPGPYT
ncbi:IS481 family transposase [Vreelandella jeotgali]|uniref:IS481 family transposase n=1 Tax=Vreelandella jeotgali TaxID=553386 RepID=UPI000A04028A|nr:IS481 family transposase [Halomonas jeotgali]